MGDALQGEALRHVGQRRLVEAHARHLRRAGVEDEAAARRPLEHGDHPDPLHEGCVHHPAGGDVAHGPDEEL